jgi:hypothetical protein
MWLMARVVFWLGIVILLLPAAPSQRSEPARIAGLGDNSPTGSSRFDRVGERSSAGRTARDAKTSARSKQKRSLDTLTPADLEMRWLRPPAAHLGASRSSSPASS